LISKELKTLICQLVKKSMELTALCLKRQQIVTLGGFASRELLDREDKLNAEIVKIEDQLGLYGNQDK